MNKTIEELELDFNSWPNYYNFEENVYRKILLRENPNEDFFGQ
ncbi:hypothetical protein [Riemerella columbipharyngis]|nr:hypothetical protein [Riemerella columbipharyngis]